MFRLLFLLRIRRVSNGLTDLDVDADGVSFRSRWESPVAVGRERLGVVGRESFPVGGHGRVPSQRYPQRVRLDPWAK